MKAILIRCVTIFSKNMKSFQLKAVLGEGVKIFSENMKSFQPKVVLGEGVRKTRRKFIFKVSEGGSS